MPFEALRRVARDLSSRPAPRSLGRLRRLASDERGSVTIEYVLWLPFFAVLIGLAADASLTFHTHSRMWDAARDAARRTATGQMDAKQAEAQALAQLPQSGAFTVVVDESDPVDVVVTISAANGDLGLTGVLDMLSDASLRSEYRMRKETWNG
jgi:Flp pilus assembly protein TadG